MIGYVKISNPPLTCSQCPVRYFGSTGSLHSDIECDLWHHVVDPMRYRHAKCPIILAPDDHGRLIDARELEKVSAKRLGVINIGHIDDTPTVIPAAGGTTDE